MKTKQLFSAVAFLIVVLSINLASSASFAQYQPVDLLGTTERVSITTDGTEGNGFSFHPSISADGRFVAFSSYASNLVPGDTNVTCDVFVHDRQTEDTSRISISSDGSQAYRCSSSPSISADGRYVAFESAADNLVPGDTNQAQDIFVHDRQTGETTRVSVASDGSQANLYSYMPAISADGRYVSFGSIADNLVVGDIGWSDVFVHDRQTGETTRVSVASDGSQGNDQSWRSFISADGRYVSFDSNASNLVPGDTNGVLDIFVHDRQTGETTRVSIGSNGEQADDYSAHPSISADGRYVAFSSHASNLVPGDSNMEWDAFVHDRVTGETTRISVASDGSQGNRGSSSGSISADGQAASFSSNAYNLVDGDTNGEEDIFVHNRVTHTTSRVSISTHGAQGNSSAWNAVISNDGCCVAFESNSTNLVRGDTNNELDVFIRDQEAVSNPGIDFYPISDGYGFGNFSGGNHDDFIFSDLKRMFGEASVCSSFNPGCISDRQAMIWSTYATRSMLSGHSDGMASTSLRFFKNLDTHPGFNITNLLGTDDNVLTTWQGETVATTVRRNIAFFFVEQMLPSVQDAKGLGFQDTPTQVLTRTISALSDGAPDPVIMFIRPDATSGGHALIPYECMDQGAGIFWIWVYDSEHPYDINNPNDSNRYVVVDKNNDTWSYNLGWSTWSGSADTHTLGIVPISAYAQRPECPWCVNEATGINDSEVWLSGAGHLLITDSQGRRLGYFGNDFVNEIPAAHADFIDAGSHTALEPIYTVPLTETFNILLDGQTLTQTTTASVAQFGPRYASAVDETLIGPITQDYLTFANDGTMMSYHSGQEQEPTFIMALDTLDSNVGLTIQGIEIAGSQAFTLTADTTAGTFTLDGSILSGGEYNLGFRMVNSSGVTNFYHANIPLLATDTHRINFGVWHGTGTISVDIDHGSDGVFEETIYLDDMSRYLFLPLLRMNK